MTTMLPADVRTLTAWACLGSAAIQRAEELARETVAAILRDVTPTRYPVNNRPIWTVGRRRAVGSIVWHDGGSWMMPNMSVEGVLSLESGGTRKLAAAVDIWSMGLSIEGITANGVTLSIPHIGAR